MRNNNKENFTIGVLGGMGTYATIHLFQKYASVFEAEKEWERPRIIIDNRCTMPSRVRAFLYNENVERLVFEMTDSLHTLINAGCTHIVLACNTSHLFLPKIYENEPEIEQYINNLVISCVEKIVSDGLKEVFLLGTEGTIESCIYQDALASKDVKCLCPSPREYSMIRRCIEAVKQNKYSDEIKEIFLDLINRYDSCILGCTELPVLYEMYYADIKTKLVYDPVMICLKNIKCIYDLARSE